jgi:hypothetical protein
MASLPLEVGADNAAELGLYVKCVFVVKGTEKSYYPDGSDACRMKKELRECAGDPVSESESEPESRCSITDAGLTFL